jgi:hypothetical protein
VAPETLVHWKQLQDNDLIVPCPRALPNDVDDTPTDADDTGSAMPHRQKTSCNSLELSSDMLMLTTRDALIHVSQLPDTYSLFGNSLIFWASKVQSVISLFSCGAEYTAIAHAAIRLYGLPISLKPSDCDILQAHNLSGLTVNYCFERMSLLAL